MKPQRQQKIRVKEGINASLNATKLVLRNPTLMRTAIIHASEIVTLAALTYATQEFAS